MSLVEGRAENTWVPPEGQHQGLHGPPTSPTLEQLGVHEPGSYTDARLPSSHLGARWESELSPPINKCSPNPATGTRAQLGFEERPLQQLVRNLNQRTVCLLSRMGAANPPN